MISHLPFLRTSRASRFTRYFDWFIKFKTTKLYLNWQKHTEQQVAKSEARILSKFLNTYNSKNLKLSQTITDDI